MVNDLPRTPLTLIIHKFNNSQINYLSIPVLIRCSKFIPLTIPSTKTILPLYGSTENGFLTMLTEHALFSCPLSLISEKEGNEGIREGA